MKVTAVIPHWNRRDLLVSLLDNLRQQTRTFSEIIVVDNGSTDGSVEAARQRGARVLETGTNRGFSHAVNQGLRAATGEWIAVLNNDVTLHPDWLERLLRAGGNSWFAAGKLLRAGQPTQVDATYDLLCRGGMAWRAGHGYTDGPLWDVQREVAFVPFTAAIFRRALFDQVGYLDEEFESYMEDVDFGLRCALKGLRGLYVPVAVGQHIGSATWGKWNKETVRRLARNQVLLVAKHYPEGWIRQFGWHVLVAQTLWGAAAFRHGAGLAYLAGKMQGIRKFRRFPHAASNQLAEVLASSEAEIRRLQRESGSELYWRLYFSLT